MPSQGKKISSFVAAFIFFSATIFVVIVAVATTTTTANAYSVYAGPQPSTPLSIGGFNFGNLLAPFQNFINSINSVGNTSSLTIPSIGPTSIPTNGMVASGVQSAFQWFDNWLYGIAGFHIGGLLVAILNVFSWLLGIVKGAVDWILGLIH